MNKEKFYQTITDERGKVIEGEGYNLKVWQAVTKQFSPEGLFKNLRVLDIGAAEGFFAREAELAGAEEVIAVDASTVMWRKFKSCFPSSRIKYWVEDIEKRYKKYVICDTLILLNIHHHLGRRPEEIIRGLVLQTNKFVLTNGYIQDQDRVMRRKGGVKLSYLYVQEILESCNFIVYVLGEYREGRMLLLGEVR